MSHLITPPITSQSDRCRAPLIFVEPSKIPQPQGAAHHNLIRNIPVLCTCHCSFNHGFLQILKVLCTSSGSNKVVRHCSLDTTLICDRPCPHGFEKSLLLFSTLSSQLKYSCTFRQF